MDEQTLEPCPFCGCYDQEIISSRLWNDDPDATERFWLECLGCGAEPFQPSESRDEIVAAWNRRAAHSVIAGKVAELTEALQQIGSKARLGGDCLGNSGPKFEPTQRAFYLLADLCDAALAPYPERR